MMEGRPLLCIKTNRGTYVNRAEFIDTLQDISNYLNENRKKKWFRREKEDRTLLDLIRLFSAFGEPPEAVDGDGGSLEFNQYKDKQPPSIDWRYCGDVGVCLRVVDVMQFILFLPLSYRALKVVMSCLVSAVDLQE